MVLSCIWSVLFIDVDDFYKNLCMDTTNRIQYPFGFPLTSTTFGINLAR